MRVSAEHGVMCGVLGEVVFVFFLIFLPNSLCQTGSIYVILDSAELAGIRCGCV